MSQILEVIMVLAFGFAWPTSIINSIKARTAKGKSPFFLAIIIFGYVCGIGSKFLSGNLNYIINLIMVSTDLLIYFRNKKLDKEKESE